MTEVLILPLRSVVIDGRTVSSGETVDVDPTDAASLIRDGVARDVESSAEIAGTNS